MQRRDSESERLGVPAQFRAQKFVDPIQVTIFASFKSFEHTKKEYTMLAICFSIFPPNNAWDLLNVITFDYFRFKYLIFLRLNYRELTQNPLQDHTTEPASALLRRSRKHFKHISFILLSLICPSKTTFVVAYRVHT